MKSSEEMMMEKKSFFEEQESRAYCTTSYFVKSTRYKMGNVLESSFDRFLHVHSVKYMKLISELKAEESSCVFFKNIFKDSYAKFMAEFPDLPYMHNYLRFTILNFVSYDLVKKTLDTEVEQDRDTAILCILCDILHATEAIKDVIENDNAQILGDADV